MKASEIKVGETYAHKPGMYAGTSKVKVVEVGLKTEKTWNNKGGQPAVRVINYGDPEYGKRKGREDIIPTRGIQHTWEVEEENRRQSKEIERIHAERKAEEATYYERVARKLKAFYEHEGFNRHVPSYPSHSIPVGVAELERLLELAQPEIERQRNAFKGF